MQVKINIRHLSITILYFLLAGVFCNCSSDPEPPPSPDTGTITGSVTDADTSALLSGVSVSSGGVNNTTGSDGIYTLSSVAVGNQSIAATLTGYQTYTGNVTVTQEVTVTEDISLVASVDPPTDDTCTQANDIEGWAQHSTNPIFASGGAEDWDNYIWGVTILIDPDEAAMKYKMWYVGGATENEDEGRYIGYATSSDGINWVPYANNPIMIHGDTWDINGFGGINVIKDGATYKLWYEGVDSNSTNRIGYATSTDGINWEPYSDNPVFSPGVGGSWDDEDVGNPWIVKDGSTFKMWYWGDSASTDIDHIGLATSDDGINWQRSGTDGLVLSPDVNITWENGEGVGSPKVIKNDSGYTMAYHAIDQSGTIRVGMATSSDGITWNKESSPILDVGEGNDWDSLGVGPGALLKDSTALKLWYGGFDSSYVLKVGLAVNCL